MRRLCMLLALSLLSLNVAACDSTSKDLGSASQTASIAATTDGVAATAASSGKLEEGSFKGDDDDDESKTFGNTGGSDSDNDSDNDYQDNAHKGYYDKDDGAVQSFGHPASSAYEQAITAVVRRFRSAAVPSCRSPRSAAQTGQQ
jgi:hypothetical protein